MIYAFKFQLYVVKSLHKKKNYKEYPIEIQEKVNLMLNHIKKIISNNEEASYNYIIKWRLLTYGCEYCKT